MKVKDHLTIPELPEDDKPREKLVKFGADKLSNAELLAIVIGSGSQDASAIDLGRRILKAYDGDLNKFFEVSIEEIKLNTALKGIGPARACQIKAAIELGRRVKRGGDEYPQVNNPEVVADYLKEEMSFFSQEHFSILILNTKNRIIKMEEISVGTINASLVHPREVFSPAIRLKANSIILAHNHPSGDVSPSQEDKKITKRLVSSGDILGIAVLDHLIIGGDTYFSFRQEGIL